MGQRLEFDPWQGLWYTCTAWMTRQGVLQIAVHFCKKQDAASARSCRMAGSKALGLGCMVLLTQSADTCQQLPFHAVLCICSVLAAYLQTGCSSAVLVACMSASFCNGLYLSCCLSLNLTKGPAFTCLCCLVVMRLHTRAATDRAAMAFNPWALLICC